MSQASTYQCPNCKGVLTYDVEAGFLKCESCESTFHPSEVEKSIPLSNGSVAVQATEHVKTVEEFLQHAPWRIESRNAIGYSCPTCGATVVADQSAVTATCPYCDNNMVVSGIATEQNVPQWVLPFSVTREQAKDAMLRHFEKKRYLSPKFQASIEHMQGVYVPYHLYDVCASGYADYIGMYVKSRSDNVTTLYNAMHRAGYTQYEKIPVDGSSKMPDAHMDAIAPFHLENLRAFSSGYVAGYLTEVPDESAEACLPRAEERARKSFEDDLRADAVSEDDITNIDKVVAHDTNVTLVGASSCVLPVWLAHCAWNGKQMLFAVNGETGKCVGDLPIDGKRRATTIGILALVLLVIVVLFALARSAGSGNSPLGEMVVPLIMAAGLTFIVDRYFVGQMKSVAEAEDADESRSNKGLVVTERWRTELVGKKSKAQEMLDEYMQGRQ